MKRKTKSEYTLEIKNLHCFGNPNSENILKVKDIVLNDGMNKSKVLWKLGRIIEDNKGHDGLVRSCVFKTKKGI